jgi:hypothetical protein
MPAIDTILFDVHNTSASPIGLTAATAATGDSATVRSFPDSASARLEEIALQASGARQFRITSPMFHDNVTGWTYSWSEQPAALALPPDIGQPLVSGDTLAVSISAAATSDSIAALIAYYSGLRGGDARLHMWGDIAGIIKSIKVCEVDVTSSATIGQWSDTLITATENQFHAKTDYAVLGYEMDTALAVVGIKGQDTANLRVCGPGSTQTEPMTDYFIRQSNRHGTPHIPVFSSDNRGSLYVSCAANTASVAAKVTLILAELSQQLPN